MKRVFTVLAAMLFTSFAFSQQITLAKWSFPTGNPVDTLADQANSLNVNKFIRTTGGVSAIGFKNGATTKAAQATGWDNGVDVKAWEVEINAIGYSRIRVSSKQTAGGNNPGPRDFKLQYRIGSGGTWTAVAGATIVVGNDWTSGVLTNIQLPEECNNLASLFLRWVANSNFDATGAALAASGIAKIDDIMITGEAASGIEDQAINGLQVKVFPNPCSDRLFIESENEIQKVEVYTITGSKVFDKVFYRKSLMIDMKGYTSGRYFVVTHLTDQDKNVVSTVVRN